jgi:hypothetical protein
MQEKVYRPGLPPVPARMRQLPIERGYPVPWFVALVDGQYDFRIQDQRKRFMALGQKRCWVCGGFLLDRNVAFVIGPMCAINRISSEPPSHQECAEFSVKACPFLNLQEAERRGSHIPTAAQAAPGCMIPRNPGVSLIWTTKAFSVMRMKDGDYLIRVGGAVALSWWREGRTATRAEILESIESGYPLLQDIAKQGGAKELAELERAREQALELLPAA